MISQLQFIMEPSPASRVLHLLRPFGMETVLVVYVNLEPFLSFQYHVAMVALFVILRFLGSNVHVLAALLLVSVLRAALVRPTRSLPRRRITKGENSM